MDKEDKLLQGVFHPIFIIGAVFFIQFFLEIVLIFMGALIHEVASLPSAPPSFDSSFSGFLFRLLMLIPFFGAVRIGEKLIFKETLLPAVYRRQEQSGSDLFLGLLLGVALFSLLFAAFLALKWLTITSSLFGTNWGERSGGKILWLIPVLLVAAVYEELLARGFLLSVLRKYWGASAGLAFSSLIFSLMHWENPHINLAGLIGILLAGVWLGMAYEITGSLWLPTALHFSWNISQTLLGFPVSGLNTPSMIRTEITGPQLWTGGDFGPEAGLAGHILIAIGILALIWYGKKRRRPPHKV